MTPPECQRILRELAATWPKSDRTAWTDEEVVVWLKTLAPLHFHDAEEALDSCREASKWLPAHAEFIAFARGARRRREAYEEATQRRALPAGPVGAAVGDVSDADRARDHIAGVGRPMDRPASSAYSRVWREHLQAALDQIGRTA